MQHDEEEHKCCIHLENKQENKRATLPHSWDVYGKHIWKKYAQIVVSICIQKHLMNNTGTYTTVVVITLITK